MEFGTMSVTLRALAYGNHRLDFTRPASFAEDVLVWPGYNSMPRTFPDGRTENGGTYTALMADPKLRAEMLERIVKWLPFDRDKQGMMLIDLEHHRPAKGVSAEEFANYKSWYSTVGAWLSVMRPSVYKYADLALAWLYPPHATDIPRVARETLSELRRPNVNQSDRVAVVTGWVSGIPGEPLPEPAFAVTMSIALAWLNGTGTLAVWCQCDTPEQAAMSQSVCERVERWVKENANA